MTGNCLSGQLQKLREDLKVSAKAAYAEGTWRNLVVQWRSFLAFCKYFQFEPLPASLETLCLYVQFLSRSFKSIKAIKKYVSGVKLMHVMKDVDRAVFQSMQLKLAVRGLARIKHPTPKQALPITPEILLDFYKWLDFSVEKHVVLWSLILLAFYIMARKSNMVPNQVSKFDPHKQLCRSDISINKDLLLVTIKWSKTNQFGQRRLQIPVLAIPGSVLCPYLAYTRMCTLIPAPSDSPAFVVHKIVKLQVVIYRDLQVFLKQLIAKTGREPDDFSSHSLRRGGASWAFRAKVPSELIQLQGD
jgi:hypothetical protein